MKTIHAFLEDRITELVFKETEQYRLVKRTKAFYTFRTTQIGQRTEIQLQEKQK